MKLLALLTLLAVAGWAVRAGAADSFVPFVIPAEVNPKSQIAFDGTPIAVDSPRVVAKDGHFHAGEKRIRIWGVNLCFGACFPTHEDAERVAARLEAFGINSVRFHHMDYSPFPRGIWDPTDPATLSPEALDRLDYFLDQLARRGIYANLNLHVSRVHSRILGLPDTSATGNFDKMVDLFTPELIEAQKRYARDLLTHVNKYRKVRYADDPAVAFVEITNEDSLFMWGWESKLRAMHPHYAEILRGQFNDWLRKRYGTADKLRSAWSEGAAPLGENLLVRHDRRRPTAADPRAWRLGQLAGCKATVKPLAQTANAVRIEIARADGTNWHLQWNHRGLKLRGGGYYTLTFRARADKPREFSFNVGQAHDPWKLLGLNRTAGLAGEWRTFRAGLLAADDDDNARVNFAVGRSGEAVEIADVELRPGGREGLRKEEDLAAKSVALLAESETDARLLDRMRFLAETEKAYFDGMYAFVKKDLGCKALVTGTIVFGPLGLYAQGGMDYIDAHAYWNHPQFPGRPWDPANWTVEQTAMVDHPDRSPLFGLAASRLEGKPFTVSEYNHSAPNDYQAECIPMIASFAAIQDWDGLCLFAYSHRADEWDRRHFDNFFDIHANPAKWGFVPAGTGIFREAGVQPVRGAFNHVLEEAFDWGKLPLDKLAELHVKHGGDMFRASGGDLSPIAELHRQDGKDEEGNKWTSISFPSEVPNYVWISNQQGSALTVLAAATIRNRLNFPAKPLLPRFEAPPFWVITLSPLDRLDWDKTRKVLVTACGRCENTGMKFNKDRRTVGRNWGRAPARIEAVTATIPLWMLPEGNWQCRALRPDGTAGEKVPLLEEKDGVALSATLKLRISPKHGTMWYLLTRADKQ